MTRPPYAIPLRPDFAAARDRPSASLVRACLAMARSVHDRDRLGAAETARRAWSDDRATLEIVQRAVSSAATSTTSGWASQLAATAVADLISTLGPASAGSHLIAQALNLEFGSAASIRVPTVVSDAADVVFVAEGEAIPIQQSVNPAGRVDTLVAKTL